jgi:hypothetical protein
MTRLLSKPLVATALLSGPASADTLTIGYWDSALGGGVTPLASSAGTEILLQKSAAAAAVSTPSKTNSVSAFDGSPLIQSQTPRSSREYAGERGLPHVQWVAPQVVSVELDQIEGPHEHVGVMTAVSDAIEGGNAVLSARHSLAVDNAGA